eukprot:767895-Hanusia_phi.AAC.18
MIRGQGWTCPGPEPGGGSPEAQARARTVTGDTPPSGLLPPELLPAGHPHPAKCTPHFPQKDPPFFPDGTIQSPPAVNLTRNVGVYPCRD